jgi:hypothetical protein
MAEICVVDMAAISIFASSRFEHPVNIPGSCDYGDVEICLSPMPRVFTPCSFVCVVNGFALPIPAMSRDFGDPAIPYPSPGCPN